MTDNGSENVNEVLAHAMKSCNMHQITTSPYHLQGNVKVAAKFSINDSSKFSSYYMIFRQDVILPVNNLLKSSRKYVGEEFHKILNRNIRFFVQTRSRIQRN